MTCIYCKSKHNKKAGVTRSPFPNVKGWSAISLLVEAVKMGLGLL